MIAILKRSSVGVAGQLAIYMRVANELQSQIVRRFASTAMLDDWLKGLIKEF